MDETTPTEDGTFDRRRFIKRVAVTSAVAVPVVSSFSMSGVSSAFAQQTNVSGQPRGTGGSSGTTTTTEGGGVSPGSTEVTPTTEPTTTTTTTVTNQGPTTTTTTTSPNQGPTTTTTTTIPNQTDLSGISRR